MSGPTAVPVPRPGHRGRMGRDDHTDASFSSDDLALNKQIVATHAGEFDVVDLTVKSVLAINKSVTPAPIMNSGEDANVKSKTEKFLINEIIYTHVPGGFHLDSELLLYLVRRTLCSVASNAFNVEFGTVSIDEINLTGSEEPISRIIYKISYQMLCLCFEDENLHTKTMVLLKILGRYRWDAKVVLALASFAHIFGSFRLILKLQRDNALAFSLARVQHFPKAMGWLKPKLGAMASLTSTLAKLAKSIITFEVWKHELADDRAMDLAKSTVYLSTYWIIRSIVDCSSQIAVLKCSRFEQVNSDVTVIATCSLHSLGMKLSSLCHDLDGYLTMFHEKINTRLYQKLLNMSEEKHINNQTVLQTLFSSHHKFPLIKNCYLQEKCKIWDLQNKIVILLFSKPDFLPIDKTFSLVKCTYDHPQHTKFEGRYEIVWVPIPFSSEWTLSDKRCFEIISKFLPWFSIRWPSSLSTTVVRFIKQEWKFKEDPLMVVLDENGMVTNTNAMDMVWIWGPKAFPFSTSREKELWEQQYLNPIHLLIDGFGSFLTHWLEESKSICIFGSKNLEWIRAFCSTMMKIKSSGIQLEVIYVGCNNSDKNVIKAIIDTIHQEKLCTSLSLPNINFFWFRLEVIKRSIDHQEHMTSHEKIATELGEIQDFNDNEKGWVMISGGSSTDAIKLEGETLKECLEMFPVWCKYVEALGLVGAIRSALERRFVGGTCNHVEFLPYEESLLEKVAVCSFCRGPMEKFVMYKCEA